MSKIYHNKLNLDNARAAYGTPDAQYGTMFIPLPGRDLEYSHAYVLSNENLRHTTGLTRDIGHRVLTVAGSGDQPFFYTLNDATQTDTFDISFCAKAIMDIKTAAIQSGMPYGEYRKMLFQLHKAPAASQVKHIPEILNRIPRDSAEFVRGMDGYKIFGNGLNPDMYPEEALNPDEYAHLQKAITGPFKFIWSDVANLHAHLIGEYDVINLSNIFEWSPGLTIPTLASLRNHIRPGGIILVQTGHPIATHRNYKTFQQAAEKFKRWARIGINQKLRDENVVILQRTR